MARLFTAEATSYCVVLPDWRYLVVFNVESGRVDYDNFNGRWGSSRGSTRFCRCMR